ncbi:MAG: hypothetical protein FWE45_05285 [Firmicutes bacterium]|nr:hypothetical protein [Bacillota bacterium]
MSFVLLKKMFKQNAVLFWAFVAGIVLYYGLVVLMYPVIADMMEDMGGIWAEMFSVGRIDEFAASMLGEIVWMIGLILFIMLVFRLIYKSVDSGSLSMQLMAGISRKKYIVTSCVYLLLNLFIIFALVLGVGVLIFVALGEDFSFANYLNNVSLAILALGAVTAISFFLGVILAGKKAAAGLLIAIPIVLYMLLMASGIHSSLEFLRWVSVFGWFVPAEIAVGSFELWWLVMIGYMLLIAVVGIVSTLIFRKKNLSL